MPLGTGRLDDARIRQTLKPKERGINQLIEFRLPQDRNAETSIRSEREWTHQTLEALRART